MLESAEKREAKAGGESVPKSSSPPKPNQLKRRSSVKKVSGLISKRRPESSSALLSSQGSEIDTWTSKPYEPVSFPPQRLPHQVDPHVCDKVSFLSESGWSFGRR